MRESSKDPAKITVENVAEFLTHIGENSVTVEQIEKDLAQVCRRIQAGRSTWWSAGKWWLAGQPERKN